MELAAFCLAFAGAAMLCLAMKRHHQQAFSAGPSDLRRLGLRAAGVVLVSASLVTAAAVQGWPIGTVEWVGALGLCGIGLNVLHGFRPGWTPYAGAGAAVLAALMIVWEKIAIL